MKTAWLDFYEEAPDDEVPALVLKTIYPESFAASVTLKDIPPVFLRKIIGEWAKLNVHEALGSNVKHVMIRDREESWLYKDDSVHGALHASG